jgi:hypothetical protein
VVEGRLLQPQRRDLGAAARQLLRNRIRRRRLLRLSAFADTLRDFPG